MHTALPWYWKHFVSGLVPSPNTPGERLCLVMTTRQDSPLLTPKEQHMHSTIEAHDACCPRHRNILAEESCCAKADRILELGWLSCLSSLSGHKKKKKRAVSWKFFFSPRKPGEVTYTKTYIWSLVLSITEQQDSRTWSDHPEVCQLLILPVKVLIL